MYKTTKTTVASTELYEPVFKEAMIGDRAQGSLYFLVLSPLPSILKCLLD